MPHTNTMTSLVAKAKISAHETLFLHSATFSTASFALMTVSKPSPASERSSSASFSASPLRDASITEASHPLIYMMMYNCTCNMQPKLIS